MRTDEQIMADAADERPFSNHSEYEVWADSGNGCYDCAHDNPDAERYCPILSAALLGKWPREWTRAAHQWQVGDKSGSYEVVDECVEFERRPDDGDGPPPEPRTGPGRRRSGRHVRGVRRADRGAGRRDAGRDGGGPMTHARVDLHPDLESLIAEASDRGWVRDASKGAPRLPLAVDAVRAFLGWDDMLEESR
jgi:hypothetical protein